MAAAETLQAVIHSLAAHGEKPAMSALQKDTSETWSFTDLTEQANRLATGLTEKGLKQGTYALIFAPNRPEWVMTCFALCSAAAVPVLVDAQMGDEDLQHVLADSEARWVFTTASLARRLDDLRTPHDLTLVLLDVGQDEPQSWRNYVAAQATPFPSTNPEDTAVLFYTSGTTGVPKGVPLSHRNLTANLHALLDLRLIRSDERVLLPLPLHHVYPFTVGMFASLTVGVPIILPFSLTGPQILRALQEGRATAIIGIPRLYAALYTAIETRLQQRGWVAATLFQSGLALSVVLRRWLGLRLGRWLFAPLHRQFAPQLRVVASGGAALEPELAWKLEGLGWQVANGYGLTETSPLLTFNPPGGGRLGTAGKPVPGVEIRTAEPEKNAEHGEVLAKGPNVFAGYRNLPDKTAEVFTDDGYFRTGDLGYLDDDGYLHLAGRASSMIVLPGGENIWPENIEETLAQGEHIREAGVLERDGQLVALIVPDVATTRQSDGDDPERLLRRAVEQQSRLLPSHHQIGEYAITFDPLPRTRLGKIRRPQLAERYEQAQQQGGKPPAEAGPLPVAQMAPEDRQLLEDPAAKQVWDWLAQRFPDVRLTPEANLQLDLGVDSLEWLNLTLEMQEHTGVNLDEEAIGRIETVRDLLREATEATQATGGVKDPMEQLRQPEQVLSEQQRQWLQPPGPLIRTLGTIFLGFDQILMRWLYRIEARGLEHLPQAGPFIIAPNHLSLLDPPAIGAVLPTQHLRRTYWGGWTGIMFTNPLMRLLSRAVRVVPVDPRRGPLSSLAFGAAVLANGYNLVWFPEGARSRTGTLQQFQPGIGLVLSVQRIPVIPTWIAGTYEALPIGAWWPRLHSITITFGEPTDPVELQRRGEGERPHERITAALHGRVAQLGGRTQPGRQEEADEERDAAKVGATHRP